MKRLISIHLHGSLRKIHAETIKVWAESAFDAITLATTQLAGFKPTAAGYKRVRVAGFDKIEDFHNPITVDELHLYPQLNGGKNGGFTQILIGATLIAAAFVLAPLTAGMSLGLAFGAMAAGAGTLGTMVVTSLFMIGVSTAIGGLTQLIMPQPSLGGSDANQEASKYLGVPGSTTAIGTTIRVIYGFRRVGFQFLSFNTNARNYAPGS
jgi:predicted phage tail protein